MLGRNGGFLLWRYIYFGLFWILVLIRVFFVVIRLELFCDDDILVYIVDGVLVFIVIMKFYWFFIFFCVVVVCWVSRY